MNMSLQTKFPFINNKFPHFIFGGDYNPDQWKKHQHIWDEDIRLMKLSNFNTPIIGVFQWSQIEPQEGVFDLEWLDKVVKKLADNNIPFAMATPTAAPPAWMFKKYPEILRVYTDRKRPHFHSRVNYCLTSEVYREKCRIIDKVLAERYKDYPIMFWHINNEMARDCHCDLCQKAFRKWLQNKYKTIENLNETWWTYFHGHAYSSWDEISSPSIRDGILDATIPGLTLDWKRFSSHQQFECYQNEAKVLRQFTPNVPMTTNPWGIFGNLNFKEHIKDMDVVSMDCYPIYKFDSDDWKRAIEYSFKYDIYRSAKTGQPFILMETSPGITSMITSKRRINRPGVLKLISTQAIAHGADAVCHFQWRAGQSGNERYHGAIVDQSGHENTKIFKEISEIGRTLTKLDDILGSTKSSEVGIIYENELSWIIPQRFNYFEQCTRFYRYFWSKGISVDNIDMDADYSKYKLLIAPNLYMIKPGVVEKLESFVQNGGILITSWLTGYVDENEKCFTGGYPGPLRKLIGIWNEDMDILDKGYSVEVTVDSEKQLIGKYKGEYASAIIHPESAEVVGTYTSECYAGTPAITVNKYGDGKVYYLGSSFEYSFLEKLFDNITVDLQIYPCINITLPEGVTAQMRTDGQNDYLFILNFKSIEQKVLLGDEVKLVDMVTEHECIKSIDMPAYGSEVYRCNG